MSTFLVGVQVDDTTHLWPWRPPSGPNNQPKYTQTNQTCPSWSNSIARSHPSLKSPRDCLYHVHLPCWGLGGSYHTFVTIGATLGPKKPAQIRQTNKICFCSRSNSMARVQPSLKSPWECLYHVHLSYWCPGGPYHTFVAQKTSLLLYHLTVDKGKSG